MRSVNIPPKLEELLRNIKTDADLCYAALWVRALLK